MVWKIIVALVVMFVLLYKCSLDAREQCKKMNGKYINEVCKTVDKTYYIFLWHWNEWED
jgi:hypothetical protein